MFTENDEVVVGGRKKKHLSYGIQPSAQYRGGIKIKVTTPAAPMPTARPARPVPAPTGPVAASSPALDPAVAALVKQIIDGQIEHYNKWFVNQTTNTYEHIVNRGKHPDPTKGSAHFDWFIFPSSTRNSRYPSVYSPLNTTTPDYNIPAAVQGHAVYAALAQDKAFISRYHNSLATYLNLVSTGLNENPPKLISHKNQNDHIIRFNKLVESYIGLTDGGQRLIYASQEEQDKITKIICAIWERHKDTSHPSLYSTQFFERLEGMKAEIALRPPVAPVPTAAPVLGPVSLSVPASAATGITDENIFIGNTRGLLDFIGQPGVVLVDPAGAAFRGGTFSANLAESGAGGLSGPIYNRLGDGSRPLETTARLVINGGLRTDRISGGFVTRLYVADACFNPSTNIIHAVGPSISITPGTNPETEIARFQKDLKLTIKNIIRSWQDNSAEATLAIPLISGGVFFTGSNEDKEKYYYPCLLDAVDEAIRSLDPTAQKRVKIVPYSAIETAALQKAMDERKRGVSPTPVPSAAAKPRPAAVRSKPLDTIIVQAAHFKSTADILSYVTKNIRQQTDKALRKQAIKTKVDDGAFKWDLLTYAIGSNWKKLDADDLNELMNNMIKNGADYNARNDDGTTLLHHLVRWYKGAATDLERTKALAVITEFVTKHKLAIFEDRDNTSPLDLLDATPDDVVLRELLQEKIYIRNYFVAPNKREATEDVSDYEKKFNIATPTDIRFLSDHTVVKFSAAIAGMAEARVFSWNMMNQCRLYTDYSNNPAGFHETNTQYRVRLDREVDYIESLLENEQPDFFNLQEAQGLFEITAKGHKKLDRNFVTRMAARGYAVVAPDEGKNLLTIYKIGHDKAKPIYHFQGEDINQDLYNDSGYSTTSVITFTDRSGKKIAIGNMHLDYKATEFPGLKTIQRAFAAQGTPCILTGDTNHTAEQMESLVPGSVGDKGHATCFDCVGAVGADGKTKYDYTKFTTTHEKGSAKSYDLAIGNGLAAITVESYGEFVASTDGKIMQQERKIAATKKPAPVVPATGVGAGTRALPMPDAPILPARGAPAEAEAARIARAAAEEKARTEALVAAAKKAQAEAAALAERARIAKEKEAALRAQMAARAQARRDAEAVERARVAQQEAQIKEHHLWLKSLLQLDLLEPDDLSDLEEYKQNFKQSQRTIGAALEKIASRTGNDLELRKQRLQVVQPFSLSKTDIFKAAIECYVDDERNKGVAEKDSEWKMSGETKRTRLENEDNSRATITANMIDFSTSIEEVEDKPGETRKISKTYMTFFKSEEEEMPLPPPGLAYATFSGLRLRDSVSADGREKYKIFREGVDITGLNFNNCDLTGLDFTGISKEMFESLKFSASCVGLDTITMPEGAKLKTSAIVTPGVVDSKDPTKSKHHKMAKISDDKAADIMEDPDHNHNPKEYLDRPGRGKSGVDSSLERLRPSGVVSSPRGSTLGFGVDAIGLF